MTSSPRAILAIALLVSATLGAGIAALSSRDTVPKLRNEVKALTARVDTLEGKPPTASPSARGGQICNVAPADGEVAIMAAITACPDRATVLFPNGAKYTQRTTIVVERRKGLTIDGNGSTFTKTAQTPPGDRHPQWVLVETDDSIL